MTESPAPTKRSLLRPPGSAAPGLDSAVLNSALLAPLFDIDTTRAHLDALTIAQPAALHVLALVDDPNATTAQVADAINTDPIFAAQLMRLANSAYYGMSGKIGNITFAVTVVGFAAVRSLAAMAAAGLTQTASDLPQGFWAHAAATAAGASAVAPRFGVGGAESFAAGLLHDVGVAFLHLMAPDRYRALLEEYGMHGVGLTDAEEQVFGINHAAAAATVLRTWNFPDDLVVAIGSHHDEQSSPFTTTLRVGEALAILGVRHDALAADVLDRVEIMGDERRELIDYTAERGLEILGSLPR